MPVTVNDVIHLQIGYSDATFGSFYQNHLRYRVDVGEMADSALQIDTQGGDALREEIETELFTEFVKCLKDQVWITSLRVQKVGPTVSQSYKYLWPATEWGGTETEEAPDVGIEGDLEAPQAAACLIKKSNRPGRRGIGKMFFGPIAGTYTKQGLLVVDPSGIIEGEPLTTIQAAIMKPLTFTIGANTMTLKPCVIGDANLATADATDDLRATTWSARVVYLKSRRQYQGI